MKAQLPVGLRRRFALQLIEGDAPGALSIPDCVGTSLPTDTCRAKLTRFLVTLDGVRLTSGSWGVDNCTDGSGIARLKATMKWLEL